MAFVNSSDRYRHCTLDVADDCVTLCRGGLTFWAILNIVAVSVGPRSTRGQPQAVNHIVELCPLFKLADDGRLQLHSAHNSWSPG